MRSPDEIEIPDRLSNLIALECIAPGVKCSRFEQKLRKDLPYYLKLKFNEVLHEFAISPTNKTDEKQMIKEDKKYQITVYVLLHEEKLVGTFSARVLAEANAYKQGFSKDDSTILDTVIDALT